MAKKKEVRAGERLAVTHQTSDGKPHAYPDQAMRHIKKMKLEDKTITRLEKKNEKAAN